MTTPSVGTVIPRSEYPEASAAALAADLLWRICSYCDRFLGTKPACPGHGSLSHGICDACFVYESAKVDALRRSKEQPHVAA